MAIQIESITLATTDMMQMVEFYNTVLSSHLTSFQPYPDATFYSGMLANIPLVMCPNIVAGVNAHQNRHQFRFKVDDIHQTFIAALNAGGTQITAIEEQDSRLMCAVYDPDGNSIVFVQDTAQ